MPGQAPQVPVLSVHGLMGRRIGNGREDRHGLLSFLLPDGLEVLHTTEHACLLESRQEA